MAEPEVATKAPENDAQETQVPKEPSVISAEDTAAQKGASMGVRVIMQKAMYNAELGVLGPLRDG